jgi:hypothetical protein
MMGFARAMTWVSVPTKYSLSELSLRMEQELERAGCEPSGAFEKPHQSKDEVSTRPNNSSDREFLQQLSVDSTGKNKYTVFAIMIASTVVLRKSS